MDGERFDAIAKATATTSRRGALRLLAGGALGGLLTRLGPEDAAAACAGTVHCNGTNCSACPGTVCGPDPNRWCCLEHGAVCRTSSQCCSGRCKKKPGAKRGRCKCPAGTTTCGTTGCCGAEQHCENGTTCVCNDAAKAPCKHKCVPSCSVGSSGRKTIVDWETCECVCPFDLPKRCSDGDGSTAGDYCCEDEATCCGFFPEGVCCYESGGGECCGGVRCCAAGRCAGTTCCPEDRPVPCTLGTDEWCCREDQTCGSSALSCRSTP